MKTTPRQRIDNRTAEIEYLIKRIADMETAIQNHTNRISHLVQLNRKDLAEEEAELQVTS